MKKTKTAARQKRYRKRYSSTVGEILDKLKDIDHNTLITRELIQHVFAKGVKK